MSQRRVFFLSILPTFLGWALPACAQTVVSTHSGLIHFFEGTVFLGNEPLTSRPGRFQNMPQGAELRTEAGRAEVLLTPGVFLRMGDQSAIRLIANDLADTQVELQAGSAILDSGEPNPDTSVTLIYKGWRVHFLRKGIYRIDVNPPRLLVRTGKAEVFAGPRDQRVSVEPGMTLPFAAVLVPERSAPQAIDELTLWENGRSDSISADNTITAQIDAEPGTRIAGLSGLNGLDGITYFPYLGLSSAAVGLGSPYSALTSPQPGFSAIYLPGYTHRPLLLGIMGSGPRGYVPSAMQPMGSLPGPYGFGGVVPPLPIRGGLPGGGLYRPGGVVTQLPVGGSTRIPGSGGVVTQLPIGGGLPRPGGATVPAPHVPSGNSVPVYTGPHAGGVHR